MPKKHSRDDKVAEKINIVKKRLKEIKCAKEEFKAQEPYEAKRQRRLEKKLCKERRRKEQSGWDQECLGYTNEDNPFGDSQLSQTFLWKKKMEKDGTENLSSKEIETLHKRKMLVQQRELEAVRDRRKQREREREDMQRQMEEEQREREAEHFREWSQQEDLFHLDQAKLRSKIRIGEGRAKPIDLLAKYVADEDEINSADGNLTNDDGVQLHEPSQFLTGLAPEDLEDLLEDIKVVYMQLEKGANADYWKDITIVAQAELSECLRRRDEKLWHDNRTGSSAAFLVNRRHSYLSEATRMEIRKKWQSKSLPELKALEGQIKSKLQSGAENIDVTYWETVEIMLQEHMALQRLRQRHQQNLCKKLQQFKTQQLQQNMKEEMETPSAVAPDANATLFPSYADREKQDADFQFVAPLPVSASTEVSVAVASESTSTSNSTKREVYNAAYYSPKLQTLDEVEFDAVIYSAEDDEQKLEFEREQVCRYGRMDYSEDDRLLEKAKEGMRDEEEAQFSVQHSLGDQTFLWSDKYRPRKPRFFNRVHTGFEWNKYNQTHYDLENPPPKIVQGYKFNIFYPDLINKSKTPNYTVTPCENDPDFAVVRFSSGPPYEDIAFRVVNREWDTSFRHGFRCQFQNSVFQLWFHFTKYRYRR